MKQFIMLWLGLIILIAPSCKKGCKDPEAINYDTEAVKDDGSCHYSVATFYASYGYYGGIPIMKIDVSVKGEQIGTITSIYPSGPGNCTAPGTVAYRFKNNQEVDWNTTVYLANGALIYGTGHTQPDRYDDCVSVNVTH